MTDTHPSPLALLWGVLRLTTRAMIGAYALSVLGFLLLRIVIDHDVTLIALFNEFIHVLMLPAWVLLPFVLVLRWWGLAGLLAPIVLTFTVWYGGMFLPKDQLPIPPDALTLVSYNLAAAYTPDQVEAVAEVILAIDADIVALQELSVNAAEVLADRLGAVYPEQALHPVQELGIYGQGMFSRYPISEDTFWRTGLGHQRAVVTVGEQPIVIYNIHAAFPFVRGGLVIRREDAQYVLALAAEDTQPVLVVGDFNTTQRSADYRRMRAAFDDAFLQVGQGFGFTYRALGRVPLARIDYVFHDDTFQPLRARVWPESAGSDHHPLVVTLALTRTAEQQN
ncbi:MAG: hypothetical protein OHK0046_11370 [Anaerolineae bacterium]